MEVAEDVERNSLPHIKLLDLGKQYYEHLSKAALTTVIEEWGSWH